MNERRQRRQAGFTLIEMILTLILVGVAAGMIVPLFQSGVTSSATPIYRLESVADLETTMANIIAAVRKPSDDSTQQNAYQVRGSTATTGGMQDLKDAIEDSTIFNKWLPSGVTGITATTEGPFKLGTKSDPAIGDAYDQNYALRVTLTRDTDGASITYIFCEGTNYQVIPDNGWNGQGDGS